MLAAAEPAKYGATMSDAASPLATPFPAIPQIAGVTLRIARAGYKDWGRCDLTYVELAEGTAVAGVFTKNVCCSSEVELGREQAKAGRARALVVNAGNSNAFTGYRGREAVEQIMEQVAQSLGCALSEVFVSSTGVIGVPLPKDKARDGVAAVLEAAPCSWEDAARTISTTDTFPKGAVATAVVDGRTVTLGAIIKGSGMIAPDMATMLGFLFTDAAKIDRRLEVTGQEVRDFDETWQQPWGEWSSIRNHYRELKVHLRETTALARVFTVTFSSCGSGVIVWQAGATDGLHYTTHTEPVPQPVVHKAVVFTMQQFAYFLQKLRDTPEQGGSLLDQCGILCTSEHSEGNTHSVDEFPILFAGRAGGALRGGVHYRSPNKENTTNALLTLLKAVGCPLTEFGYNQGKSGQVVQAVLA